MHLSTPALFAPYVRLELLRWDPLFADASSAPGAAANGSTPQTREGVTRGFEKQAWWVTVHSSSILHRQ
jgi:GC-rich sequence DNA-binding factor